MFRSLEADGVSFHLSLSLSPTLASMLSDKVLCDRYIAYLDSQLALAAAEEERVGGDPAFGPLARMYKSLYRADKDDFVELYGRDILGAFDYYYKKGRVELMTSAATHAFLPLFRDSPEAIAAQVETAIITHRKAFGKHPAGFWLPQLGWYPEVAEVLRAYNVQYTVITTKGAIFGDPTPERGSFAPVECPSGLLAFVRDAQAADAVLSESSRLSGRSGLPGLLPRHWLRPSRRLPAGPPRGPGRAHLHGLQVLGRHRPHERQGAL